VLLGAEKYGISDAAYPYIDQCVTVPMLGMVESFNVGVACAIILAEARGQREAAGFYEERQMSDEVYKGTLFEWTQPLVAKYCQKHSLPYPVLNEKGDIINLDWRKG
jgi:tRNA (guanosine-2'-O-)-methyltransferase